MSDLDLGKYATLDVETRTNLELARAILKLDERFDDAQVRTRLTERRKAGGSDSFPRLPYHEPVTTALLLAEKSGEGPGAPILCSEWRVWRAGDLELGRFLERFFEHLQGRTYVGFASQHFDLPLLELWASKCLVNIPGHFDPVERAESPRNNQALHRHCDLQRELVNFASNGGSLDELCKFHGLPGKSAIHGEDVEALWAAGRTDEILSYNVTDVLQTHLLFLHTRVRNGRLTREAARESAESALSLTRERISPRFPPGSPARLLLEGCLAGCERSPLATPTRQRAQAPEPVPSSNSQEEEPGGGPVVLASLEAAVAM